MVLGSRLVAVTWTCFCYPWQQIRGNVCTSFSKVQLMEVCNIRSSLSWVLYVCLTHSSPVLYFSGLFYRPKQMTDFYVTQTNDWFLCDPNKWLVSMWPKQITGFYVTQTNDWFLCGPNKWLVSMWNATLVSNRDYTISLWAWHFELLQPMPLEEA